MRDGKSAKRRTFPRRLTFDLRSADQVIFLATPYVSAEAFFTRLAWQFPPEAVWTPEMGDLLEVLEREGSRVLEGCRLLYTQHDYAIYRCFQRKPVFATLFRDPFARVLEAYEQARQDGAHPLHDGEVSLGNFLDHPRTRDRILNGQTRQLVGLTAEEWPELSDEALLDLARLRLEEFAFIGLEAKPVESMQLFSYTFSLPRANDPDPAKHRSDDRLVKERDPEKVRMIRRANHLDVQLYQLAVHTFERRLVQMRSELRHPPEWKYAVAAPPWYRRTVLRFGANLRRWHGVAALGRFRRRFVPEGSRIERTYVWLRRRLFGW